MKTLKEIKSIFMTQCVFIVFQNTNNKLIRTEFGTFQEISKSLSPAASYDFYALGNDFGVIFTKEKGFFRNEIFKKSKLIFTFEFKNNKTKPFKPLEYDMKKHLSDKFIYKWHFGDEKSINLCNGMMLIHSNESIIIVDHENDINEALSYIKKYNIYRIEDEKY